MTGISPDRSPLMTQPDSPRSRLVQGALWAALALALAGLALAAGYFLRPLLHPEAELSAPLNTACDLRAGPCTSTLPDGGRITLSILPRSLPLARPLEIEVRLEGVDAREVAVDFVGVNMDMGLNRAPLQPAGEDRFTGSGMLPVCARSRMVWDARVLADTGAGLVAAPFRFETRRP